MSMTSQMLNKTKNVAFMANILMIVSLLSFVLFSFPDGQVAAYSTLLMTIGFVWLINLGQEVSREHLKGKENSSYTLKQLMLICWTAFSSNFPIFLTLSIISFLVYTFVTFRTHINDLAPPKIFTRFSHVSNFLLFMQILLIFRYITNEMSETKDDAEGKNVLAKAKTFILSNLNTLLLFFSLINSIFAGFLYIIISKFITDG